MTTIRCLLVIAALAAAGATPLRAQHADPVTVQGDSLLIRFVDVDLRGAVQALARHLDRPVVFGEIGGGRITLETPHPIPRGEVAALLRGVLESHNVQMVEDGGVYRLRMQQPGPGLGYDRGAAVPYPESGLELFVIRLRHARAADVAATVNALYGRASALGELGMRPPTLGEELRQSRVPPMQAIPEVPGALAPGRNAALAGEVTMVPDARTNSLLVRASRADFELVQAVVEQLDVRPLQVLIEVVIAEVRRDRSLDVGVGASLPVQLLPGTTDNTAIQSSTTGIGLGDFVLRVMNLGGVNLDVTLRAAASRGSVSILSRPVLLTANNERAQILVGSQRPFVQVQRALPTDAPVRDQVVQYKDVGTQLSVRPTISMDGYVMLEVVQEVNAATTETAFDAPVISTRAVQTQLLVRDGQTAVLGGLADRQRDVIRGGVPFLSELPLLGWVFGRRSQRSSETELFLFLTPRVIRDDAEMDSTARDVRDAARRIRTPVNRALNRSPAVRDPEPPTEEREP